MYFHMNLLILRASWCVSKKSTCMCQNPHEKIRQALIEEGGSEVVGIVKEEEFKRE